MSKLPPFPQLRDFKMISPEAAGCTHDQMGYERARAEAALARLRDAVALLRDSRSKFASIVCGAEDDHDGSHTRKSAHWLNKARTQLTRPSRPSAPSQERRSE